MPQIRLTPEQIRNWPSQNPLLAITAYDYTFARLFDEAGADILHVGDSLGMVLLGHPDTTRVTMDDILRATAAVAQARSRALITADLPIHTYNTPEDALRNAKQLIDAGADAVKMEGGQELLPQIRLLRQNGIELQGHLGMLPQRVLIEGGYKRKGKTSAEAEAIMQDAMALEREGCFSIVLEVTEENLAANISRTLSIPTIGIGSGKGTRGQIQVMHDLLGLNPWFVPKHAIPCANLAEAAHAAIQSFRKKIA